MTIIDRKIIKNFDDKLIENRPEISFFCPEPPPGHKFFFQHAPEPYNTNQSAMDIIPQDNTVCKHTFYFEKTKRTVVSRPFFRAKNTHPH